MALRAEIYNSGCNDHKMFKFALGYSLLSQLHNDIKFFYSWWLIDAIRIF
jgi:hypothetical protein